MDFACDSTNFISGSFRSMPTSDHGTVVLYRSPAPFALNACGATTLWPEAIAEAVFAAASMDGRVRSSVKA